MVRINPFYALRDWSATLVDSVEVGIIIAGRHYWRILLTHRRRSAVFIPAHAKVLLVSGYFILMGNQHTRP